jgi:hypothetical protein
MDTNCVYTDGFNILDTCNAGFGCPLHNKLSSQWLIETSFSGRNVGSQKEKKEERKRGPK